MSPKLDFLICASPTAGFFSQIAFFRLCLNSLPEPYRNARLVAVFGDADDERLPIEWRQYFDKIEIEWVHSGHSSNRFYQAQHDRRFEVIRPDADLAILCDADVALIRPFDELISSLRAAPALAGVIAHYHFPWEGRERLPDVDWPELAKSVISRELRRPYRYTLLPQDLPPTAPFYINFGVFFGPPDLLKEFYKYDKIIRSKVESIIGPFWATQVSVPLTCAEIEIHTQSLPMRYNFPNDKNADRMYSNELQNAIFIHYLRLEKFQRNRIFAEQAKFHEFMSLQLQGSNAVFQAHVERITSGHFPFDAVRGVGRSD